MRPKRTIQLAYDHADAARLNLETAFARADRRESLASLAKEQLEKALAVFNGPKPKCPHRNALVIIASPAPGVKAERWCPECGAHYGPIYTKKHGWKTQRRWHLPGSAMARAYVALCEEVRANEKRRHREERAALRLRHFKENS
jgi:hypothetical protein